MIIVAVIMNKKKARVIQFFFVSLVCSLTFELDYLPKSLLHINPLIYQLDEKSTRSCFCFVLTLQSLRPIDHMTTKLSAVEWTRPSKL